MSAFLICDDIIIYVVALSFGACYDIYVVATTDRVRDGDK